MITGSLDIKKVIDKIKELPTLPDVVFKVNEVVNNPNTSASDLEQVISRDQAIAAKVLKLVNSAFYGLPGRVDTLSRAIPLLGFSTVRNIVLSLSMFDITPIENFDIKAFWRHSFSTSIVARTMAIADGIPEAETFSLAGLLHDLGKVMLIQHYAKEYQKVIDLMNKKKIQFLQAERTLYSIDHAQVGGILGEKWGFPANITASIAFHHNPEPSGDFIDFVGIIAAANVLTQISADDSSFFLMQGYQQASDACGSYHYLTEKAYNAILKELEKQMPFFENFIDRMELFRRPSPLVVEEERRIKEGRGSIWTLPPK